MKKYVMSPTISQEALMGSSVKYDNEGWKIIIFDIPGAYLNVKITEDKMILTNMHDECYT